MSTVIKDGTGGCKAAKVDASNRLHVDAKSHSLQHDISHDKHRAFQVRGSTTPVSGTATVLHIANGSTTYSAVVTYIRVQAVLTGGTAPPDSGNYFDISHGRTYSSGGTAVTPVNVFLGSSTTATALDVTAYDDAPTLAGTAVVLDRWYVESDGAMETFNKDGAVVIAPNQTLEVSYTGDHTGGVVQARVSFLMMLPEE
jgi:hypothetical protein